MQWTPEDPTQPTATPNPPPHTQEQEPSEPSQPKQTDNAASKDKPDEKRVYTNQGATKPPPGADGRPGAKRHQP